MSDYLDTSKTSAQAFSITALVVGLYASALGCAAEQVLELGGETQDLFGSDDRKEAFEVAKDSPQGQAVAATAALLSFTTPVDISDGLRVSMNETLGDQKELCEGVRFAEQPVLSSCTGFLVGPDLLLTAGHCVDDDSCSRTVVVFDYALHSEADPRMQLGPQHFPAEQVYNCVKVEAHEYVKGSCSLDYALLRLDRTVEARSWLSLANEMPNRGTSVFSTGHPNGLPLKVVDHAIVRNHKGRTFGYELDLFAGNSGSPILDSAGIVQGIHICGGDDDYTDDPAPWNPDVELADGSCNVPKHCDQYCGRLGTGFEVSGLRTLEALIPSQP